MHNHNQSRLRPQLGGSRSSIATPKLTTKLLDDIAHSGSEPTDGHVLHYEGFPTYMDHSAAQKELRLVQISDLDAKKAEVNTQKEKLKEARQSARSEERKLEDHKTNFAAVVFRWIELLIPCIPPNDSRNHSNDRWQTTIELYELMLPDVMKREAQLKKIDQLKAEGKDYKDIRPRRLDIADYKTAFEDWLRYGWPARGKSEQHQQAYDTYLRIKENLNKSATKAEQKCTTLGESVKRLEEDVTKLEMLLNKPKEDPYKPKVTRSPSVHDDKRHRRHSQSKIATPTPQVPKQQGNGTKLSWFERFLFGGVGLIE
ncbi:hypothetical protein ACMFMF_003283 [Clarireedia jacksonii]